MSRRSIVCTHLDDESYSDAIGVCHDNRALQSSHPVAQNAKSDEFTGAFRGTGRFSVRPDIERNNFIVGI